MSSFIKVLVVALIFNGSGCAALQDKWHTNTVLVQKRGDEPENYEHITKNYLKAILKDPFSAAYEFQGKPFKSSFSKTIVTKRPTLINVNGYQTTTVIDSWQTDVMVNAKNSYGAYVGWKRYQVHIVNNEAVHHTTRSDQ